MILLYVIGEPGSGKTTAVRALLDGWTRLGESTSGDVPLVAYEHPDGRLAAHLGRERGTFSGTDALSLSIMPKAVRLLASASYPLLIGEGDRLASDKFFDAAIVAGYDLRLAALDLDRDEAARRRAERGSNQSRPWIDGRHTKTRRLAETYGAVRLDATLPPADLAARLADLTSG